MDYVIEYSAVSTLFLLVTTVFYFKQKRVPSLRDHIYSIMLISGLVAAVFDCVSGIVDPYAYLWPKSVVYLFNALFALGLHLCPPAFCYYVLVLTGKYSTMNRRQRRLVIAPFILIVLLVVLSAFTKIGIFYLDDNNMYQQGAMHMALYIISGLYIFSGSLIVFFNRKDISKYKTWAIYAFVAIIIVIMGIQSTFPQYLLMATATGLALTVMFHILQSPSDHIDPLTDVFNRSALPVLVQDLYEQKQTFTVILLPLRSFGLINYTFGAKVGDGVLNLFADYLKNAYPARPVIRMSTSVFAMLCIDEKVSEADARKIQSLLPRKFNIQENEVEVSAWAAVMYGEDFSGTKSLLGIMDYVLQNHKQSDQQALLMTDEAFRKAYDKFEKTETALTKAILSDEVWAYYQPVVNSGGRIVGLEALARIRTDKMGDISADEFVRVAEQTGEIYRLGEQVLQRVCEFIIRCKAQGITPPLISINLSMVQCMQDELSDILRHIVEKNGVAPSEICYEIIESEALSLAPVVKQNIDKLHECGFKLLMDDFGTGYANFGYFSKLPLHCVKIDKQILWEAVGDKKQRALLLGIDDVMRQLGLRSVCKGVESKEQLAMLRDMGVEFYQGFYFSEPLAPKAVIEYLKREKEIDNEKLDIL